jgi:hypothetical protein
MRALRGWSWSRLAGLLAIFLALAHCDSGGGGCGGCDACGMTEIPGGFPADQRIENGIQVRLSEHGLGFVEENASGIVGDLMPTGLSFDVPAQCGIDTGFLGIVIDVCGQDQAGVCTADNPPCNLQMEIVNMVLTPEDPPGNVLDVQLHMNIWTTNPMKTHGGVSCNIDVDTRLDTPYLSVATKVVFEIDPTSGRTTFRLSSNPSDPSAPLMTLADIDDDDIDISGGILCWVVEIFAEGMIVDQITGMVDDMVGPLLDSLCVSCDQGQQCPQQSTCDGQVCQEASGNGCVAGLGMEGRMDMGALMASIAPGLQANMDILTWMGGYATTNDNGVSLGMHGGALSPEHNDCVPLRDPPDLTPAPISSAFQGNTRPTDNAPFDVGIGIHKKFLDAVGFAVYDSGMLCLDIGPNESTFLTSGTFAIMIPSIYEISHDDETPMVVAVRPQNPLYFELSEPDLTQDAETGEYTINTPLMTIRSDQFAIDFYALIDYRYVRLFRLNGDLVIPMALAVNAQNQLVPIIGDLGDAFENISVTDSQLLEEDPAELAAVFPTLMGMVAGMLGSAISPIDLPDMQGFSLVIDDGGITSVDANSLLAIYADLAYQTPSPKRGRPSVLTTATLLRQYTPPASSFRVRAVQDYYTDAPSVTLELGGSAPDGSDAELEWQYRFNDGLWSPFTDSPVVTLRRPVFFLQGRHHIDVRGRVKGAPQTLDPEPIRVDLIVDAQPPTLAVLRVGDQLWLSAQDRISDESQLQWSVRIGAGQWSPWQAGLTKVDLPAYWRQGAVGVRVRDEAGNEASTPEIINALYGRVTVPPSDGGCGGCNTGNGAGGGLGWLTLMMLGLWIVRRRRNRNEGESLAARRGGRRLPFLVVILALAAPGTNCDCGKTPHGDQCPDGGINLVCSNDDLECMIGQELAPTEPQTQDPETCQPIPVVCECAGDPDAVDPDDYGRFLSISARDGDVYISCYSDRYTDLIIATVDGTGLITPEPVDGVPDGPVTLDPDGYRDGIRAKGDNIGTFTSSALADDGTLYVSYIDNSNNGVKLARGVPGAWDLGFIESYTDENTAAWYTALLLLPDGRPAVGYMVNGLVDPNNPAARISELRYAVASVTAPADASDWSIEVVDQTSVPCTGLCGADELCVADTWLCAAEDTTCGECGDAEGCVAGVCVPILEEPSYVDHPEGTGLYLHLELLADGQPVMAYHDRTLGLARLAVSDDASGWQTYTLEGDEYHDVGLYMAMAVDASDVIYLSYTDAVSDDLIYFVTDTTGATVLREVIDDGIRADGNHVVGLDSVIFLDGTTPTVLYQDGTSVDLWIATRNGTDDWTTTELRTRDETNHGFFVDFAVDTDGTIWVAEYVYDWSLDSVSRLEAFVLP